MRTQRSSPALAASRPSALSCTVRTQLLCPVSAATKRCAGIDHTHTVLSSLALASSRPSSLKCTQRTPALWPLSTVERPSLCFCFVVAGCGF
jgi:hypothetical protein